MNGIARRMHYAQNPQPTICMISSSLRRLFSGLLIGMLVAGCATVRHPPSEPDTAARLTPATPTTRDLLKLPPPKGQVVAAVYGFRDQTGQYKPAPDSSFSTSVTQGAAAMLIKALKDSGWYTLVERENLQNLLTERKIVRALETPPAKDAPTPSFPPLLPASVLIEGGVIAYESNVRSGGAGARFLGIGLSSLYRVDQVTVNLRIIDIRRGQILHSVSTSKTIYSYEIRPSVFKFVNFKDLVEVEVGMTRNEPAQLCVNEAIEAAVVHLIVQGIKTGLWALKDEKDWQDPVIQTYLRETGSYYGTVAGDTGAPRSAALTASAPSSSVEPSEQDKYRSSIWISCAPGFFLHSPFRSRYRSHVFPPTLPDRSWVSLNLPLRDWASAQTRMFHKPARAMKRDWIRSDRSTRPPCHRQVRATR
jgi:curli production assembly/transport component CsgG